MEFLNCERVLSIVIPTEPSASGRRGINAERFAWTVEKKESLRVDPSAAPQDDSWDPTAPTPRGVPVLPRGRCVFDQASRLPLDLPLDPRKGGSRTARSV